MTLFAPDLYRNFAFGFVAGGLIVGASTVDTWTNMVEAPAQAAAPIEAPSVDDAFVIVPLESEQ